MFDAQTTDWSPDAFLKAWNGYIAASQAIFQRFKDPNLGGAGSTPLPMFEAWQDFAKSLGIQSDLHAHDSFDLQQWISNAAPALGWNRDHRSTVQRMLEIGADFQRRYTAFAKQGADISERALQAARRRMDADPRIAGSPAAAYEAWIDCAETAYSQAAHGETFAQSLGELCNLVSAFKVERGKLLDSLARHLDLPSRAEVDTLHRQVRDLNLALRAAASRRPADK
jgi:class III poly(R)-hydroxyalkanoic acid synthase PhaE subunit